MSLCPICHLPEDEHQYDRAAWGCHAFDVTESHPRRPIRDIELAVTLAVALLVTLLYFGADIDRALILIGLIAFAPWMSGGIPSGKHEGELDG